MRWNRIFILLLLLLLFSQGIFSVNEDVVIQSGHISEITALVFNNTDNLLFSASTDGTVRVWDADTGRLFKKLQISYLPVKDIAVHPEKPFIAVLVVLNPLLSVISVWNWETEKVVYSIKLDHIPLFFTYSTKGSYFVYTKPSWNSIVVHDGESGKILPIFIKGFGIVSYVQFSKTENNLMTYQPSGKISYWDIKTQKSLLDKPLSTIPNLSNISINISKENTFIAASTEKNILIVNILNGKVIDKKEVPGIYSTAISPTGKKVICISKEEGLNNIHVFSFLNNSLKENAISKTPIPFKVLNTPVYVGKKPYFSTQDGKIIYISDTNEPVVFAQNRILPISDIALTKKQIALGTTAKILTFPLNVLDSDKNSVKELADISYKIFDNILETRIGLNFLKTHRLIVWSKNNTPNELYILDIRTGDIIYEFAEFESSLIQLNLLSEEIITLEKNGRCMVLDSTTLQPHFTYTETGLNNIISISDNLLVGARSKFSKTTSPLIKINTKTGETVPLSNYSLLSYELAYSKKTKRIYSLGIDNAGEHSRSQFKVHRGRGYEREKVLFSFPEEDFSASIIIEPEGKLVYTSLGYNLIKVWNGKKLNYFEKSSNIPRELYVADKFLISLNKDLSLTIWNRFRKKKIYDLYFFDNFVWVAEFPDGNYITSEGAEEFLQ